MPCTAHSRRAPSRPLGLIFLLCAAASTSLLSPTSRAQETQPDSQSVAEAARAEKSRKSAQPQNPSHVYTNEDLHQSQILTQQDRARVEARKNNSPATPAAPADPSLNAEKNSAPQTLGEVAHSYRRQKLEAAQSAEAAKQPPATRFPMDLAQPSLAAPAAKPAAPLVAPTSHPRTPASPLPRIAPTRRDPFSRQSFSPALPGDRNLLSPKFFAPPKPAVSFAEPAPRVPAVRAAPPATPVAPALSNPRSSKQIQVQPGDSLWKLARRHLGSGSRWNDLLASNPEISDPSRIHPGALLVVPASNFRPRVQPSSITIHSGDSLWKIAASQLGTGAAWPCLAQANPQFPNPNHLRPGQPLTIPASCSVQPSTTSATN
jgi:nucleoid-associated protein YgaU